MTTFLRNGCSKLNERFFRISGKQYTVYVEGDIDKLFWKSIFPVVGDWAPKIEVFKDEDGKLHTGWKPLIKYLETQINKGYNINFLMAIDGDYNEIIHHKKDYENVVMTQRYNIENYIYCGHSLNKCMQTLSYGLFDNVEFVKVILNNFAEMIKNLIIIDCVNEKNELGLPIYDFPQKDSQSITSIKKHVENISKLYKQELNENKKILDGHNIVDYVRWKEFNLGNIIRMELNKKIRKENSTRKNNTIRKIKNISIDTLNSLCVYNCTSCKENCPGYTELKLKAMNAFKSLNLPA